LSHLGSIYRTLPIAKFIWHDQRELANASDLPEAASIINDDQLKKVAFILNATDNKKVAVKIEFSPVKDTVKSEDVIFINFNGNEVKSLEINTENAYLSRLNLCIQQLTAVTENMEALDRRFSLRKDYILWARRSAAEAVAAGALGPGDAHEILDRDWDAIEIEAEGS
jgi:hypothetical protein